MTMFLKKKTNGRNAGIRIRFLKSQGVTKRCRLCWLTNSAIVYEPKCGGGGKLSASEYSCAHGAQINCRDLTPYLTYVKPVTGNVAIMPAI